MRIQPGLEVPQDHADMLGSLVCLMCQGVESAQFWHQIERCNRRNLSTTKCNVSATLAYLLGACLGQATTSYSRKGRYLLPQLYVSEIGTLGEVVPCP